jgi:hypothetical protein
MADGQHNTEPAVAAAQIPPNTMIRVGLVRMPDLTWAQSQAEPAARPS